MSEPRQHVPDRIVGKEPVEVLRFEAPAFQPLERGSGKLREGPRHGLPGSGIAGDVESEPAVPRNQKRLHRPVPAVSLRPARSAVLELDQRLEVVGTGLGSAELLTAHAGEVDNRGRLVRKLGGLQRPLYHAPQPDRRPGAVVGRVLAEGQKLRHQPAEPREDRQPLRIAVRPQDGHGPLRIAGVVRGRSLKRPHQRFENRGRRRMTHRGSHSPAETVWRFGQFLFGVMVNSVALATMLFGACSLFIPLPGLFASSASDGPPWHGTLAPLDSIRGAKE